MRRIEGQIRKALSGFYYVSSGGKIHQTRARGNFRKKKLTPLVGDEVVFSSEENSEGYILELLPRKNDLVRPPVANVDQGVVVTSLVEPNFSYNLLDRFLVTLENKGIYPVIYLSKTDLVADQTLVNEIRTVYEPLGYPVIDGEQDKQRLTDLFAEKLTVFMGQSGAGKSTLLNDVSPELNLETGEISDALGRGRHTTRHVELLELFGGLVADTPGFSSIEFLEISADELPKEFPEFLAAAPECRFRECHHVNEPGCEVKRRLEIGEIAQTRYDNYLQFLQEIEKRRPVYKKNK
ncbi:ribosome small subunit-dependent GTPase A [Enterococcus pseudoavium]|uniref:Small ribosomal subunit biogenesis GTPase RsgA n=1 Tax=Enterococcus pseudoavium TaxID=44007 RepID=A0AAE4I0W6_9ENTE|nr:ribosome small subunit-dependent GTPase A [Enterococcus pseudoavium]MDT2736513.1 ribosome small subunit-dependent GTPase A [Enterococcus pseudoavium]MDT2755374.1 ribosome small subunit-dependent GTPase A [Enterococcus pseudoavium]MDT2771507.1 ribosome small subunit-dependent GTPase A [Enterococcus pseudoavium]REC32530.1 ribosome small subunit-dependent GTPase A [Enterococcus pseudoavium]